MSSPLTPVGERYNFAAEVLAQNESRASKIAYIDDTQELTYEGLSDRVRRFAAVLGEQGMRPEERVLVVLQDTIDLPTVFLGALYAGVIPVLVNTLLPAADYAYMLENSGARLIVVSEAVAPKLVEAQAQRAPNGDTTPTLVSHAGSSLPGSLGERISNASPQATPERTHIDDIAFWLYSSGSTGRPKGTVHTHANIYWTVALYAKPILGIRETDVVFSAAKLFFAYGLGNGLTFPLSVGATTVLMAERATPPAVFERLRRHKATVFGGVPTLYLAMLASSELPAKEDLALRVCASAGETLPEKVGNEFTERFGCHILDGLGSTEMLHIYLSNRPGDVVYGTTGRPVPGYEVELRDAETGLATPVGEIGDLYVKGPSAALMYWRDRERSRATFLGAWLKTGDRYLELPSGHFRYAGRSDDLLKVSGQYVAPVDVEQKLQEHEAVLEAAVVGRLDANGLVRVHAVLVLRPGHEGTPALVIELQSFVKEHLAPHKYPREIAFVDELPKTATGKIQRFKLR